MHCNGVSPALLSRAELAYRFMLLLMVGVRMMMMVVMMMLWCAFAVC